MEKLFLETENGLIEIDTKFIEKYNIKKGQRSPFSGYRIVDENGNYSSGESKAYNEEDNKRLKVSEDEVVNDEKITTDGIDEMDNGLALSTSEIIDFSQGTDSSNP